MANPGGPDEETWKKMSMMEKRIYVFGVIVVILFTVASIVGSKLGLI